MLALKIQAWNFIDMNLFTILGLTSTVPQNKNNAVPVDAEPGTRSLASVLAC